MMRTTTRSRAEEQFRASQKKDEKALKEKESLRKEKANQLARLRGLRLAKEAADKRAAEKPKTAEPDVADDDESRRLPSAHRRQS